MSHRSVLRLAVAISIASGALGLAGCGSDSNGSMAAAAGNSGVGGSSAGASGSSASGSSGTSAGTAGSGGSAGSCTTMMFDKYGASAFVAVRDSIVSKALAAPTAMLGDAFQNFASSASSSELDTFKQNLADFLVMVYGGPNNYHGASMAQAHAGLAITSDQYDYFIANVVVPALADNGVPSDDISNCFAPPVTDAAFKASIVGK